jgi:hypothetical protein
VDLARALGEMVAYNGGQALLAPGGDAPPNSPKEQGWRGSTRRSAACSASTPS